MPDPASPAEPVKFPTPKRPVRHNEWTRAKMAAFLRELAASQSVSQAAKSVGMGRQSAYKLRNRLAGTPFALAWEVALEAGLQQLAHALMDRALNGEEVPHYYRGELVGTSRRYDNRLAAWLLENPWKVGRQQVAREYVGEGWDALLERVEWASLDWEEGEALPGHPRPFDDPDDEDPADDGDDPDDPIDAQTAQDIRIARADRLQSRFIANRSWYAAEAVVQLERGPRGGVRGR